VYFREIAVENGESFSFVEDIRDYADLRHSGAFVVQARVYPELYQDLPVPGEVPGADDDAGGVHFVDVVHGLEHMTVPDQIETQGLNIHRDGIENLIGPQDKH
jgi:hypothetical protein